MSVWPRLTPLGDLGLLVEFPPEVSPEVNALVRGADAALAGLPGVQEAVPAFRSLLLVYDPLLTSVDDLATRAEAALRLAPPAPEDVGTLVEVPVSYGGAHGPDLDDVARTCGLSPAEVVRLHSGAVYRVYMLGFAPGFPYLGLAPAPLRIPRRAVPRTRVPAGSVAIADLFTGIYPQETAGGWHLLGRTPLVLFDPQRDPPCLLRPGDRVRFVPVDGEPHFATAPPPAPFAPRRPVMDVIQPGLMSTVQDLGRPGWRRLGIPASGALDGAALRMANVAVGNPPGAAVLEVAFPGPKLQALTDCEFAVAGADLGARLNATDIELGTAVRARPGDVLTFAAPRGGQWAYLALAGGVEAPAIFGSRATHARGGLGGVGGRMLRAGDVVGAGEAARTRRPAHRLTAERSTSLVRVILGPQAELFTAEAQAAFLGQEFDVTVQRDRSGVRLKGPRLTHVGGADILSDGLLPGAVQVPAEGAPVIILADGPTTGGYAKVASAITADLGRLAQRAPGQRLRFAAVSIARAHEILRAGLAAEARPD